MATKKTTPEHHVDYDSLFDRIEKKFHLSGAGMNPEAARTSLMSTGLLGTDLLLGGGIRPGALYTLFGGEGSAKSTHKSTIMISAAKHKVPALDNDYEGSTVPEYIEGIMKYTFGPKIKLRDLLGVRDDKGKWVVSPKIRSYTPSTAEEFFNPTASLLRNLPDKIWRNDQWWLSYEASKNNRAIVGSGYDKRLFSETGMLFVPCENGLPQIIFFVDSYPAMFPAKLDEDDAGAGMAAVARAMAENLPKVGSKLKPKGATIIGINQLRQRPAVMYGDPSYEPAGETVKFWSSCRIRQTGRSVPHDKGQFESEESVLNEGNDTYRYVHMKTIKNKLSTPNLETWQRIWVDDGAGGAHGFCPVWDVFHYLKATGQATGTMRKMSIPAFKLTNIGFIDLKRLVLAPEPKVLKALKLKVNPEIRKFCFRQMKSGEGTKLFFENVQRGAKKEEE